MLELYKMGILSVDTSPEAEKVQLDILRRLGPVTRLEQLADATRLSWELVRAGTDTEDSLERWLGAPHRLPPDTGGGLLKPIATPLLAASRLKKIGIPYVIGGSYASSIHGEPRSTRDCDFLIELDADLLDSFVEEFQDDFYLSRQAISEAIELKRSFNLIHLETGFKLDLFVSRGREYDRERLARGISLELARGSICVSTAEDTILSKLEWYSTTPSDQQWRDILGVLLIQSNRLDQGYLRFWSTRLGLESLLDKALQTVTDRSVDS